MGTGHSKLVVAAIFLAALSAEAAPRRIAQAGEPPAMPARPETVTQSYSMRPEPLEITIAGALVVGGGHTIPGIELGAGVPMSRDLALYLGADLGLFAQTSPFNLSLAVLPQFYFKFHPSPKVQPRLGIAIGPVLSTGGGYEAVELMALFVPGIDVWVSRDTAVNFLPKMGVLATAFVFLPQLGVTISL